MIIVVRDKARLGGILAALKRADEAAQAGSYQRAAIEAQEALQEAFRLLGQKNIEKLIRVWKES
jgi:hypothetical protein